MSSRFMVPFVLALTAFAPVSAAQTGTVLPGCPCASYGPYPCATTTVVALPDQTDALGLTDAQRDAIQALRDRHLQATHEILGDIQALRDALHRLDRPYDMAEVFALFYDLGGHEAELNEAFQLAATDLLALLTDAQRERWAALLADASSLQEAPVGCEAPAGP